MGLTIKTRLANKNNYGNKRTLSDIKYIVIHYTANDGDSDEGNANYFANNVLKTSAHYFVDDDSATQSVPDDYIAWHCGANKYYHSACRNNNSIGVEMCDTRKNGIHDVTEQTLSNTIELVKTLMNKYNIPINNIVRHYDVTHKNCPAYFVSNPTAWQSFKNRLTSNSTNDSESKSPSVSSTNSPYRIRKSWSDVSSQIGAFNSLDNAKAACKNGYYVFDAKGNIVYPVQSNSSSTTSSGSNSGTYKVKSLEDLNIRMTPNGKIVQTNGAKKGIIYTIIKTQGTWGFLKSGAGWICISSKYVKRV